MVGDSGLTTAEFNRNTENHRDYQAFTNDHVQQPWRPSTRTAFVAPEVCCMMESNRTALRPLINNLQEILPSIQCLIIKLLHLTNIKKF